MAKMTRRWRRQARRKLGETVDKVYGVLEKLAHEAEDLDDQEALADCKHAFSMIDATLTPDGLPTDVTAEALPKVVSGPFARVLRRLHPELPVPPDAENTP